ncbi:MAG: VOC family protein [Acidimicrobiia bacterium]|nr:VOC family protein [Acidimicrobiia bacterium]MBV8986716.1 VOC family protein [Acidimicrobiia bacterium]MBV9040151.1 VOC family protein [Acidimicrobiia bacterium]
MSSRLVALAFDAHDPLGLARFWAGALLWDVQAAGDVVSLLPTDGTRFRIDFASVPEPKTGQNRIHLDLTTRTADDQTETVETLLALGASHIDIGQGADEPHVVLADPEGNEFCVIEPDNSFLAGCGRLGAINCEGSAEVGYFWSEALAWPLVWDQDGETAIRHPDGTGPLVTWSPDPPPKVTKNRLHLDIAPPAGGDQAAEVDRLLALGATRNDVGQGDVDWIVMADPEGNEFCVLTPR